MLNSGDGCPRCKCGRLRTVTSRPVSESMQLRYLECNQCSHREKALVPAERVFRRSIVETKETR